ncbi:MAG: glycosyltransferase involved in cell wall biosynthesis [Crocinitomicaceae bacterium]|jgi:glycosyltransferase involved in cell wall biosynthesis
METGKRILFLSDINSVHTERWVKNLIQRGYSIDLFSLSQKHTDWSDECENFSYECYGIEQATVVSSKRYAKFSYFKARKNAKKFFDKVQPDLVHAHYATSYGMLAKYIGFKKTVLSLWGTDVYDFPKKSLLHAMLFKRVVKFPKIVCSTSNDMAVEAKKWVDRNYVITPFGVDTNKFVPKQAVEVTEMLTIGTVKTLEDIYGIDRLIDLYAQFRAVYEGPSCLKIYGQGSKESELKDQVRTLGLENEVTFGGYINQENLAGAFQSLDIFVALSRQESFGVAVLEAQSCGIPVLVSDVGGLPEVVAPEAGRVVSEDHPESWTEELVGLAAKIKTGTLEKASRDFVVENFSQEVCVDKIIQVYQDVQGIIA